MKHPTRNPVDPHAFLAPYVEALARVGVAATPRRAPRVRPAGTDPVDAWLTLRGTWGKADWACERRNRLERATLGPVVHRMTDLRDRVGRALLITEHVTPPLAEELRERGIPFVDAAGNAYLEDRGLYVWVNHRTARETTKGQGRGLHAAGLKLTYALLRRHLHEGNQRTLAREAGIGLGGVPRILDELERRDWIRRGEAGVELRNAAAMLQRWGEGYADTLRPKLWIKTCRRKPGEDLLDLPKHVARVGLAPTVWIGGELGAACLTGHLRPETATLHVDADDAVDVMKRLDLVPDPHGDVHLIRTFGQVNRGTVAVDGCDLVDPLLIRGELQLHADDRLQEIARLVLAQHIEPRWT